MAMQLYTQKNGYSADVFLFCESDEWTQGEDDQEVKLMRYVLMRNNSSFKYTGKNE
jgi:hypothetical protein